MTDPEKGRKLMSLPSFRQWFGDSKLVDASGHPAVVYHGSDEIFTTFEMGRKSFRGVMLSSYEVASHAAFFSVSEEDAQQYGSNVRAFYLSIQNPLLSPDTLPASSRMSAEDRACLERVYQDIEYILEPAVYAEGGTRYIDTNNGISRTEVDADAEWIRKVFFDNELDWTFLDNPQVVARLKERGYDGVRVSEPNDSVGFSWAVFDPAQIKLATGKERHPTSKSECAM